MAVTALSIEICSAYHRILLDTEEFNRMMKKNTLIIRILPACDPSYILWLTFPLNNIYESNNPDLSMRYQVESS